MALKDVRIKSIKLGSLRGFYGEALSFVDSGPAVIIGKNGTCKTTLLRALAGSVGGELGIDHLFRHGGDLFRELSDDTYDPPSSSAHFYTTLVTPYGLVRAGIMQDYMCHDERGEHVTPFASDGGFIAAYGVSRFFSGPDSNPTSEYSFSDATGTLFNIPRPLTDPELTIRRLKDHLEDSDYVQIWDRLKLCIGLTAADHIELRKGGGIDVVGPSVGKKVDFYSWADGFRITATWLLDFFAQAMKAKAFDVDGHISGVLLVDEIEQHLHPSMQLDILPKLQSLLPKCQIIVTTHSPLVALSVPAENIISLQKQPNGNVVRVPTPNLKGFSAEDVLTHQRLFDSSAETAETTEARTIYAQAVRSESSFGAPKIRAATELLARHKLQDIDPDLERSLSEIMAKVESQK